MTGFVLLFLYLELFYRSDATRCFDCHYVQTPHDCTKVKECDSGEYCYTEQIVTTSGNVVFNTGCLSKSKCPAVNAKRSGYTRRDSTDLTICVECCTDNFCNMKGCGTTVEPIQHRGPFCYNCDSVSDPKSCESVSSCMQNEVCILSTRQVKRDLQQTTFKSQCGAQLTCSQLSTTMNRNTCLATCCSTDFCNDHHDCGMTTNISLTTRTAHTSLPTDNPAKVLTGETTTPSTVSRQSSSEVPIHCNQRDGYVRLHLRNTVLCVHIINEHATWEEAQSRCKHEGGHLIVLDTSDKAILIRRIIREEYHQHHSYWIGAKDFHDNDHFYWVNNHRLKDSNPEWADGQPNIHTQDCVAMMHNVHFHWNNRICSEERNFICQQA